MEYRFKSSPAEELKRHGLKIDIFEGIEAKGPDEVRAAELIVRVWNEGIAKDAAEFLLSLLARRELTVTTSLRERALSCVDFDQLGAWIEKAGIADSAEDVFAD
jgi:hypothetical protein